MLAYPAKWLDVNVTNMLAHPANLLDVNETSMSPTMFPSGAKAKALICKARKDVATMVGGTAEDIIFTSGGTEVRHWNCRNVV